jgi:hypothetical protein
MKNSMLINFNASPLRQQVEDCHQVSQSHLKIFPYSRLHLLAVTHSGQQRKDTLDHHPHIPRPSLADFYILRIAFFAMESGIREDNHSLFKFFQQRVKFAV